VDDRLNGLGVYSFLALEKTEKGIAIPTR